jgi:hypothetical protein
MQVQDLDFKPHPSGLGGARALVEFENSYGASVVTGSMFYTNADQPYEIAVLKDGTITYDTPITDDVLGYLTEEDANTALTQISEL